MIEMSPTIPTVKLNNGVEMPRIGLGTWPMTGGEAAEAVAQGLSLGWRLIDTAENYANEESVGEGIRKSGIPRSAIFITSKFNRQWHSVEGARKACEASLQRLGLDYLDLFLIHWPNPDQDRYVEAFQGLVELSKVGLVRAIGVCNFKAHHLQRLLDHGLVPGVNQIQLNPYQRRDDIVAIHEKEGIITESWSPVGRAGPLLSDPAIASIAAEHGRTPGQIILRWHIEHGYLPIPKSSDPIRQAENLNVFDFALTSAERVILDGMDKPDLEMRNSDEYGH